MSKQYWNGVLNKLPNFFKDMGKLCMNTAMMDRQMRHSGCCHGGSIFCGNGMNGGGMDPSVYMSGGGFCGGMYPSGGGMCSSGMYPTSYDNQGMYDSLWGNFDDNSGMFSYNDQTFNNQMTQLFGQAPTLTSPYSTPSAAPSAAPADDE